MVGRGLEPGARGDGFQVVDRAGDVCPAVAAEEDEGVVLEARFRGAVPGRGRRAGFDGWDGEGAG